MHRRRVLTAIGGGLLASSAVGAAKRGPPPRSGPPADQYTGPMISAHEHLLFMPEGALDGLVDWMDANDWERLVAFSTPPLLEEYADHPSQFIPFNQAPFSAYALPSVAPGIDPDRFPPYLPEPDDTLALEDLPAAFDASLETDRRWEGIGEVSLRLIHRIEGDAAVSLPDAPWVQELASVAADHDVTLMLHPPHPAQLTDDDIDDPAEAVIDSLGTLFDACPDTQFLIHGLSKPLLDDVNSLLEAHDNWVYDVSGIMFGHGLYWQGVGLPQDEWDDRRQAVATHFSADEHDKPDSYEAHVDTAWDTWGHILTEHPDRVLWGVDSGRPWHFYDEFFDIHDRLYRGLLGRLPEAHARKIAHVNARRYL